MQESYRSFILQGYLIPALDRPNLKVLTGAYVRRVITDRVYSFPPLFRSSNDAQHLSKSSSVVQAPLLARRRRVSEFAGAKYNSHNHKTSTTVFHTPVSRSLGNFSLTCNFEFPTPDAQRSNRKEGTSILMCNVDICNTR